MSNKEKMDTAESRGEKHDSQDKKVSCNECNLPNGRHAPSCSWNVANLI